MTRLGFMMAMVFFAVSLTACGGDDDAAQDKSLTMESSDTKPPQTAPRSSSASGNTPPTISSVTLIPEEPRVGESLTAVVDASDREGDAIRLEFRWTLDGEPVEGSTEMLVLQRASKGDQVGVSVVARDAFGRSESMEEFVMVGNQIPTVRVVVFEPLGEVSVGNDVTAAPRGFDADRDELSYEFEWSVNGVRASTDATLPASRFRRGDEIILAVVAYDGEDRSEPLVSDPVEVANAPPKIVSDPPGFDGEEFSYQIVAEDPDNDRSFRYFLEKGPNGMQLDSLSGVVSWKPSSDQAGRHRVKVRVEDQNGGSDQQSFDLTLGFEAADSPASPDR